MQIDKYALAFGRVLMALYFLIPGVMKFLAWDLHIALMEKHGMAMIPFFLVAAGVVQIVAAILLIANRYTAIVALILAALVIVININLHDFWNFTGIEASHETQNFVKNLGIFAGLLILAGHHWHDNKKAALHQVN